VGGTANCSTTATPSSPVGSYPISCTAGNLSSTKYSFSSFPAGTLIITQAPSVTTVSCPSGVIYTASAQTPCTASVAGAGGLSQPLTVSYTSNIAVGTAHASASFAGDANHTGNSASEGFFIIYRWDGYLQPINDTAHQIGLDVSVFKAGSTVPAKLQLKAADGTVVQSATLPVWLAPVDLGLMSSSIDELVYSDPASSGNTFKWDGTQYQYNWSTKGSTPGHWYRISAKFDDGTTRSVVIGLK
jgi:hypothetical protein